ncbi:MAG: PilZ domain-containing protein [Phycisphaerae bacterium]
MKEAPQGQLFKRRHYRWTWRKRLTIWADERKLRVRTFDLSEAGAGLLVPQRLTVGSMIRINGDDGAAWIRARVVHVDGPDERGLFRTGVEFLSTRSERDPRERA